LLKNIVCGLALTTVAGSAAAQEPVFYPMKSYAECGKSETIVSAYLHDYNETPYFNGIGYLTLDQDTTKSGFLVIASNLDTGSFSVVMNFTDGTSCVIVSGLKFQPFELPKE
jgi:hypothetical protein